MSYHLLRISHIWKDLSLLIQQKRRVIRYLPTGWIRLQLGYSAKLHHRSGRWLNSNIVKVVILVIWIHYSNQHLQHHDISHYKTSQLKRFFKLESLGKIQPNTKDGESSFSGERRKQCPRWATSLSHLTREDGTYTALSSHGKKITNRRPRGKRIRSEDSNDHVDTERHYIHLTTQ